MRLLFFISTLCCCALHINAQDIHFSQFYNTPIHVNPALTGAMKGDIRAIINYKDQWNSFNAPYNTFGVSVDAAVLKNRWKKGFIGVGGAVFHDRAGDLNLSSTTVIFSAASFIPINKTNIISAGISGGFGQRAINSTNMQWGNQFDEGTYVSSQSSGESNTNFEPFFYGDIAAGVNWNYFRPQSDIVENNELRINVGAAIHHINKPSQQFLSNDKDQLHMKITAQAGAFVGLGMNGKLALLPSFFFARQGPSMEINFGLMGRYTLKGGSEITGIIREMAISIGAYYRHGDAVIPAVVFEIANFGLAVSYDVNVSDLNSISLGQGGFEVSLRYIHPNPFGKKVHRGSVKFL